MATTVELGSSAKAPFDQDKLDTHKAVLVKVMKTAQNHPGLPELLKPIVVDALRLAYELAKPQPPEDAERRQREFAEKMSQIKGLFKAVTLAGSQPSTGEETHQVFHTIRPMQFEEPAEGAEPASGLLEKDRIMKKEQSFEHDNYIFTLIGGTLRSVKSKSAGWEVRDSEDDIHTVVITQDGRQAKLKTVEIEGVGVRYEITEGDIAQPELKKICKEALEATKSSAVKVRLIEFGAL